YFISLSRISAIGRHLFTLDTQIGNHENPQQPTAPPAGGCLVLSDYCSLSAGGVPLRDCGGAARFHEPGGFFHTFTFLMAMFLVFNIKGNMIACMMIDTSVEVKKVEPPPDHLDWRECSECQRLAPPRSWHCKICKACVLKRDHHCLYTGCCIGLRNHRFFMGFIFYLFVGAVYALVYNSIFMWIIHGHIYCNWLTLLKLTCPMLLLVTGSFWSNMYLLFYSLNVLGPGLRGPPPGLPCAHRFERRGFRRSHTRAQAKVQQRSLPKSEKRLWRPHAYSLVISTNSQRSAG
ncbi:hypothetical protein M5D96_009765, partial [Drosophila gunungcola]